MQVVLGRQFYRNSINALRHRTANMDVLIALGSTRGVSPERLQHARPSLSNMPHGGGHAGGLYYDSAAMILTLITLGRYLEARARGRASDAVRKLLQLAPREAAVEREGREVHAAHRADRRRRHHHRPPRREAAGGRRGRVGRVGRG